MFYTLNAGVMLAMISGCMWGVLGVCIMWLCGSAYGVEEVFWVRSFHVGSCAHVDRQRMQVRSCPQTLSSECVSQEAWVLTWCGTWCVGQEKPRALCVKDYDGFFSGLVIGRWKLSLLSDGRVPLLQALALKPALDNLGHIAASARVFTPCVAEVDGQPVDLSSAQLCFVFDRTRLLASLATHSWLFCQRVHRLPCPSVRPRRWVAQLMLHNNADDMVQLCAGDTSVAVLRRWNVRGQYQLMCAQRCYPAALRFVPSALALDEEPMGMCHIEAPDWVLQIGPLSQREARDLGDHCREKPLLGLLANALSQFDLSDLLSARARKERVVA